MVCSSPGAYGATSRPVQTWARVSPAQWGMTAFTQVSGYGGLTTQSGWGVPHTKAIDPDGPLKAQGRLLSHLSIVEALRNRERQRPGIDLLTSFVAVVDAILLDDRPLAI